MDTQTFYEILGYIASGLVALSLTMKRILYLRVVNLIGAIVFTVYGAMIGAYPIVIVNGLITLINLYYLYQMLITTEYFRLLELTPDDRYLYEFLDFYAGDIAQYTPNFEHKPQDNEIVLLVLRNMVASGVLIGYQEGDTFHIALDYVTPGYRDFKSGQFIFRDSRDLFAAREISKLVTVGRRPVHEDYLQRVGFVKTNTSDDDGKPQYVMDL